MTFSPYFVVGSLASVSEVQGDWTTSQGDWQKSLQAHLQVFRGKLNMPHLEIAF